MLAWHLLVIAELIGRGEPLEHGSLRTMVVCALVALVTIAITVSLLQFPQVFDKVPLKDRDAPASLLWGFRLWLTG